MSMYDPALKGDSACKRARPRCCFVGDMAGAGHTVSRCPVVLRLHEQGNAEAVPLFAKRECGRCSSRACHTVQLLEPMALATATSCQHLPVAAGPYPAVWDTPAFGTGPSKLLGQARSWDMPFTMLGTGPFWGHALPTPWDMPALGTCPLKYLGQARFWDRPFKIPGTGPF